jgi:hypothetical protein
MNVLALLPKREIEGADEVLEGMLAEVASGNQCRIWPAMTYDREHHETRIAFFMEWRRVPTPDDIAEVTAYTNTLMRKPPELMTEAQSGPCAEQENIDWLRTGKAPKPRRTN